MPRTRKKLPKYSLHKPSGQARVLIDGKSYYLGQFNSDASREEYDRLMGIWLASGRNMPQPKHLSNLTVTDLCVAYFQFCKSYYAQNGQPTSEVAAIQNVLRSLRRLYGRTAADDFGPKKLKVVIQHWIANNLVRGTINQHIGCIKRMFRWAASEELIPVVAPRCPLTPCSSTRLLPAVQRT